MKRALPIREKALEPDDPAVGDLLELYANVLRKMNREREARAMAA
ncbi:MAG: hypothetical protein HY695_22965, partial [Deltaproteobacteria bacterium]|nr:hypothetical protein [Deltaproteobacteria bacterium]